MTTKTATAIVLVSLLASCATATTNEPSATASEPPATPSTSATVLPSSPSSPAVPSASSPNSWTRVLTVGDGTVPTVGSAITHGGAGFLAITTDWVPIPSQPGPGRAEYSIWHSPDGFEWSDVGFPTDGVNLRATSLYAAADGSYVVHGSRSKPDAPYFETFALRSSDGAMWEEVATGLPDVIYIQAIEAGPSGYLLVGGQGADTNPTLWLSADGLSWELVYEFQQDTHWVQIHDADGGQEGYVVLGRRIEPEGPYRRFAFASADGREWFNLDEPFGPDNQGFVFEANVSSLGPDWVATLGHPSAPTAIWYSASGLSWSEVSSVEHEPASIAALFEEVRGELTFSPGSGVWDGSAGVWSSLDGVDWIEDDFGGERVWLGGITEGNGVIAASGTVPNADFISTGGIWIRTSD